MPREQSGHKSHILKILTSKLFAIRILQTLFANTATSKSCRGWGEGGYTRNERKSSPLWCFPGSNEQIYYKQKSTG
jgi:hypothetical protein